MKKRSITLLLVIVIILFSGCSTKKQSSYATSNQFTNLKSGIIKISEGQGDEVYDDRSPADVCNSMLNQIQDSNPDMECQVINSGRVDNPQNPEKECPTESSIAGCFSCTFDCK